MTAALAGGEWSAARFGHTLPPRKTQYPIYRRLGGPQGRSGRAENLVPTGIRSRTVQPVVSHYTDWATRSTRIKFYSSKNKAEPLRPTYWSSVHFVGYFIIFCQLNDYNIPCCTLVISALDHFMTNFRVKWNFLNHRWSFVRDALALLQFLDLNKCYRWWTCRRRSNISLIYHECFPPTWDQSVVRAVIITLKCCPSVNYPSSHNLCPSHRTPDPCDSLVGTVCRWTSHIECITVSLKLTRRRQ